MFGRKNKKVETKPVDEGRIHWDKKEYFRVYYEGYENRDKYFICVIGDNTNFEPFTNIDFNFNEKLNILEIIFDDDLEGKFYEAFHESNVQEFNKYLNNNDKRVEVMTYFAELRKKKSMTKNTVDDYAESYYKRNEEKKRSLILDTIIKNSRKF